jgi:alpha-N-acetylglucosamine transferase
MHGGGQETTWADRFTKLMVFNLTRYEKVLYMDNDNMVPQVFDSPFSHCNLVMDCRSDLQLIDGLFTLNAT